MIFGAPIGGPHGSNAKNANEGSLGERMLANRNIKEKDRIEKERAKEKLEIERRRLQHDKLELSSRESDLRRVISELTRAEEADLEARRMGEASHQELLIAKEASEKIKKEIEAAKVHLAHLNNDLREKDAVMAKLVSQKSYKELEVGKRAHALQEAKNRKFHEENEIKRLHSDIARTEQDIARLEGILKH